MSNKGQILQDPFLNALRKDHVPVSIYLVNGIKLQGQVESFDQYVVLLKNTECKFGPGGQADHLAMVYLTPGDTTKYQLEAIKVEGVLKVKPFEGPDGNTWSVYDLTEAKVVQ